MSNERGIIRPDGTQRVCAECGQPLKRGRHKPGEYVHAEGCSRAPKPRQRQWWGSRTTEVKS